MVKQIWKIQNLITMLGLLAAIVGIILCYNNMINYSIILLVFAGICDGVDGTFARKISKDDNKYGTHLDSLNDIVSSGIYPVIICMALGYTGVIDAIVYAIYMICGITRLAYYNVNSSEKGHFVGVPITTSTILIPLIYLITKNEYAFLGGFVVLSILFVSNIKIPKPSMKVKVLLSIIGIIASGYIILCLNK